MSGMLSPLFLLGSVVSLQFISGLLLSHRKDFIWVVILSIMSFDISFVIAKYIALDWIRAFRINFFPLVDRYILLQFFIVFACVQRMVFHWIPRLFSFSTYAPNICIDSQSPIILIFGSIVLPLAWSVAHVQTTSSLYFFVLMDRISDFFSLNLAVKTSQKSFMVLSSDLMSYVIVLIHVYHSIICKY